MIDFTHQDKILSFFQDKIPLYIKESTPKPTKYSKDRISTENVDKKVCMFFQYSKYTYNNGTDSNFPFSYQIPLDIYFTFQDFKQSEIDTYKRDYLESFIKILGDSGESFNGIVNYARVETIEIDLEYTSRPEIQALRFQLILIIED